MGFGLTYNKECDPYGIRYRGLSGVVWCAGEGNDRCMNTGLIQSLDKSYVENIQSFIDSTDLMFFPADVKERIRIHVYYAKRHLENGNLERYMDHVNYAEYLIALWV